MSKLLLPNKELVGIPKAEKKVEKLKKDNVPNFFMMPVEELRQAVESDPDFPKVFNFRLMIVLPILENTTPSGGIEHTQEYMEFAYSHNNIGRFIKAGSTVGGQNTNNFQDCRELEIGDYVHYSPHMGYRYNYNGTQLIILEDVHILGQIYSPKKHTDGVFETFKVRGLDL